MRVNKLRDRSKVVLCTVEEESRAKDQTRDLPGPSRASVRVANISSNLWRAGLSEGGGKVEMVAECFMRGEHPEAKRRCPRNSILETAKSPLGRLMVRPRFRQRQKNPMWEEDP